MLPDSSGWLPDSLSWLPDSPADFQTALAGSQVALAGSQKAGLPREEQLVTPHIKTTGRSADRPEAT